MPGLNTSTGASPTRLWSRVIPAALAGLAIGLALAWTFFSRSERHRHPNFSFEIRDADTGKLVPGKLVFLRDGIEAPLGARSHGHLACRRNTIYTADGQGEVAISPGAYEVWIGHGPEYSADVQHIEVKKDTLQRLAARIRHVVQTPGYVSGDMHLHTLTFSLHGDAFVDERIISCIGEGLEWAVATDHNHVTDYAPFSKRLGLEDHLATNAGNEVSTPIGHFNAYPLKPGSQPTPHGITDARKLFKLIRSEGENVVVQVNHPRRLGADYFSRKSLASHFAVPESESWSWNFDAFEVLNGNRGVGWKAEDISPVSVKQDWFNMLNNGRRFAAVGNSDSHDVERFLAGMPRNYIASSAESAADIDVGELVQNIRAKNISVSRGIYLEFSTQSGGHIGQQVAPRGGEVRFHIRAQAPEWVDCDTLRLIANGRTVRTFPVPPTQEPVRFDSTISVTPEIDSWYIVVASGSKSMAPLVHDAPMPITPLAFTNPIWVDADGDGEFTSLLERAGLLVKQHSQNPAHLRAALRGQPQLRKYAIAYLAETRQENQLTLLKTLLAESGLDGRLFIYKQLGKETGDEVEPLLAKAFSHARLPLEKLAIDVVRVRRGETERWQAALQEVGKIKDHQFLKTTMAPFSRGNYLRQWKVAGPYPFPAYHGLDVAGPPEPEAKTADPAPASSSWTPVTADEHGYVDLAAAFAGAEHANGYASAEFNSKQSGRMAFLIGSDDGVAVWLNGEEIHRHHIHRHALPGEDVFAGRVHTGRNHLLVKVENGFGAWGFYLEPLDVEGWLGHAAASR